MSLLKLPDPVPSQFVFTLNEVTDAAHAEYVIGAWCMAAHDVDRQVSAYARESWERFVFVGPAEETAGTRIALGTGTAAFARLWEFAQRVLLYPAGVYTYVNPPPSGVATPGKLAGRGASGSGRGRREDDPPSRSGREDEEESDGDRRARLRISGFGVTQWALSAYRPLQIVTQIDACHVLGAFVEQATDTEAITKFIAPFENQELWSALYHAQFAPFLHDDVEALGYNQPVVRRTAWSFVQSLLRSCKGQWPT